MIEILKIGENTSHPSDYTADRKNGYPFYLFLLLKTDGMFFIDNEWKRISKDTAFLFKPEQRHLYHGITNDISINKYIDCWAHISCPASFISPHFPFGLPITLHNPDDYYSLFHLIQKEFFGEMPDKYKIMDSLMSALLLKLNSETKNKNYPDIYYSLVELRKNIYISPYKKWSVKETASSLGISTGYFHSIYKQFFQITFINDVIKSRIEYSCELLSSTHKSVEEIAFLCGYNNTEHYIRQFKSIMNTTPLKYSHSARL